MSVPRGRLGMIAALVLWSAIGSASCMPGAAAQHPPSSAPSSWLPDTPATLRLRFEDEFDTLRLRDPAQGPWSTTFGYGGVDNRTLTNNHELQLYVDPAFTGDGRTPLGLNPFAVREGALDIVAERVTDDLARRLGGYRYTSGLLTTHHAFSQTYGYFELRAKLPAGKGLWPAFWLLPEDGSWPPEIDIFEQLGREPDAIYVGVHTNTHNDTTTRHDVGDTTDGFHKYGVLWDPEHITWFVDERQVHQIDTPSDMHKPMYVLINLAVGGDWAQAPDQSTVFPARMSIDYVRVYSLDPR
ncbi:MAG TPA: glycoside hydrolase family 16 protein [Caulobacterales bacterium]|nr:glycoside hydrolase family 16 protein [Caulobacterales bacterium]